MSKKEITLRPYQENIIQESLAAIEFGSDNIVIDSPPACVPGFTEFLTPYGWKRIDEYKDGDLVCQWKLNGETKFIKPSKYINQDCKDNFINIKTNGINITVSENHKMPYLTNRGRRSGNPSFLEAKELIKMGEIVIPRYFQVPENVDEFEIDKIISYKNLSDDILKVIIMQSADGNIIKYKNSTTIRINVKKERKKERARLLLSNAKIEYTEKIKSNGYSCFYYKTEMPQKDISFLYNLPEEKLKNLAEEIVFWDGSNQNIDRSNANAASFCGNKRDVDAAQYALAAAYGNYISMYKDKRKYKNEDIYSIRISQSNKSTIKTKRNDGAKSAEISYVEPDDGKHYCFETESGFWLMRQNNQIYPTGNSGKSLIISETANRLQEKGNVVVSITITALLDQIAHHLDLVGADYSILKAGREKEFDITKKIQLVQAHTLHARLENTSVTASYFLMDEVHREYKTDRTNAILKKLKPKARIGYSGTCYDQAGFALEGAEMLQTATVQEMEDKGYLCPIKYYVPLWAEQIDFSSVKSSGNDYNNVELERIINTTEHLKMAIESMNQMNAKNKKTMVFCSSIEQAEKFTNMLNQAGYEAMSYHSKSDNSEDILEAFKNNTPFVKKKKKSKIVLDTGDLFEGMKIESSEPERYVKCLVSINRLGIGFDCPDVVLGVQLRPTLVRSLFIQQVMRLARKHESKQFSEYLDLAQTTSRFGFHTDLYIPPARTGDSSIDKKAIQDAESHLALEDLSVLLTNELQTDVTRNIYIAELEKIKKSLKKDLYSMDIYELAKAYEISKDHKEIITIATIIYTMKWGKPVSKNGYEYNYKPETYWQASTYGNPNFHVHHDMDYYFEEFPNMKKQWIKSLKTRCRNIIKEELGLFRITGFIQFLRDKYIEETTSIIEYKKDNSYVPEIDIDEAEIPF